MPAAALACLIAVLCSALRPAGAAEPPAAPPRIAVEGPANTTFAPLDRVTVVGARGGKLVVTDGNDGEYVRVAASARVVFTVAGALGTHRVRVLDAAGRTVDRISFLVDASTAVDDDGGRFHELLDQAKRTMISGNRGGDGSFKRRWRERDYHLFVPWVLDQSNTAKGLRYFSPHVRDGVELFRDSQKADGMIWSFVSPDAGPGYYDTAYGHLGYTWHDGGSMFVRQPTENHVEYEYVNMLHGAWKASGDDAWMAKSLDSAMRALEYTVTDRLRWSQRFQLLKRPYTIDSWDFQVDDKYTPKKHLSPTMGVEPGETKMGVFFGDNTGYMQACERLAEMLERSGRKADAARYRERRAQVLERLDRVSWNGRFYRHFVEEDPSVKRDLGVDEAIQLAQGNTYSLNRGLPHDRAVAIVRTYQNLREHLPPGSPGEWYAIYPPFERGFGPHGGKWQYMNGGVAGHAAGELARGAFEHGFERYAASVLDRTRELGKIDGKIHFAYRGAIEPPPPAPRYTPLDLSRVANMDLASAGAPGVHGWMAAEADNDLSTMPTGKLVAGDVPFLVTDPARNGRRAVIGVSERPGYARQVNLSIGRKVGALALLHAAEGTGPEEIAASLTFRYHDGSERGVYLKRGKHVSSFWFPKLPGPHAGVAWRGANGKSRDVGLTWAIVSNPEPDKAVKSLSVRAAADGGRYALAGLTLADRPPHQEPGPVSYGGPDNWAAATVTAALLEGLAGVGDVDRAMGELVLSPRWVAADVRDAKITARYPASKGYVTYAYHHDPGARRIDLTVSSSARATRVRMLLPAAAQATAVTIGGAAAKFQNEAMEDSRYASVTLPAGLGAVSVKY